MHSILHYVQPTKQTNCICPYLLIECTTILPATKMKEKWHQEKLCLMEYVFTALLFKMWRERSPG